MQRVRIIFNEMSVELEGASVLDLLKKEGINPETVLVKKNSEIVTEDTEIKDGDVIKTITVISGG